MTEYYKGIKYHLSKEEPLLHFKRYYLSEEEALLHITQMVKDFVNNTNDSDHNAHWKLINDLIRFLDVKKKIK